MTAVDPGCAIPTPRLTKPRAHATGMGSSPPITAAASSERTSVGGGGGGLRVYERDNRTMSAPAPKLLSWALRGVHLMGEAPPTHLFPNTPKHRVGIYGNASLLTIIAGVDVWHHCDALFNPFFFSFLTVLSSNPKQAFLCPSLRFRFRLQHPDPEHPEPRPHPAVQVLLPLQ